MTIIAPSLLSANFLDLKNELKIFEKQKDLYFHLDIMDAHFVPNLTFGPFIIEQIAKVTSIPLDAHLMVNDPTFFVESLKDCRLKNITVHQESTVHLDRLLHLIKSYFPECGVALNPATPLEALSDYILKMVDMVLIMSVNPGFGGQKFIPSTFEKVKNLNLRRKKLRAKFLIEVDGGVNEENAPQLIKAGVDVLVAGSTIFSRSPSEYLKTVKNLKG